MIASRFATDQKNFQVKKFITVSTDSRDKKTAYSKLKDIENNLTEQFKTVDINIKPLNGSERLNIFGDILRGNPYLDVDYNDVRISGLTRKSYCT